MIWDLSRTSTPCKEAMPEERACERSESRSEGSRWRDWVESATRTIHLPSFKSLRTSDLPRKPRPPKTTQVLGLGFSSANRSSIAIYSRNQGFSRERERGERVCVWRGRVKWWVICLFLYASKVGSIGFRVHINPNKKEKEKGRVHKSGAAFGCFFSVNKLIIGLRQWGLDASLGSFWFK